MSRHPWPIRILRACLALWFVLSGGGLGVVHDCPMHDAVGGHAHVHGVATHAMGHHAVGSPHGAARHDGSTPAQAHTCTCLGACSAAAAVAAPVAPPAVAAARYAFGSRPTLPDAPRGTSERGAHLLPFGNGPPAPRATA